MIIVRLLTPIFKKKSLQVIKHLEVTLLILLSVATFFEATAEDPKPKRWAIVFGGDDSADPNLSEAEQAQDEVNQFYHDFWGYSKKLKSWEKYIYYGGEKAETAAEKIYVEDSEKSKEKHTHYTWSKSILEKKSGLAPGSIQRATQKNLMSQIERALDPKNGLKKGDQLLLTIKLHGQLDPFAWQIGKDQFLFPKQLIPKIKKLKENGVKVGMIVDSCFSGQAIDLFSEHACVVSSTQSSTRSCSNEMSQSFARELEKNKSATLESLYLSFSNDERVLKNEDSNCIGWPSISGVSDQRRSEALNLERIDQPLNKICDASELKNKAISNSTELLNVASQVEDQIKFVDIRDEELKVDAQKSLKAVKEYRRKMNTLVAQEERTRAALELMKKEIKKAGSDYNEENVKAIENSLVDTRKKIQELSLQMKANVNLKKWRYKYSAQEADQYLEERDLLLKADLQTLSKNELKRRQQIERCKEFNLN